MSPREQLLLSRLLAERRNRASCDNELAAIDGIEFALNGVEDPGDALSHFAATCGVLMGALAEDRGISAEQIAGQLPGLFEAAMLEGGRLVRPQPPAPVLRLAAENGERR